MHAQESQPAHVADLLATELGGSGINSIGGRHVLHATNAAAILPPPMPRYPLAPPVITTNCKRPWDRITTTENIGKERVHLPLRQDRKRPWDKPNATTIHEELLEFFRIPGRLGWASCRCSQPSERDRSFECIGHETMQIEKGTGNLIVMWRAEQQRSTHIQSVDFGGS